MRNIIAILLLVVAMGLGYTGVNMISNSGESVEVVGVELSVSDDSKKTTGFIYLGLAVVSLIGGVTLAARKK